MPPLRTSRAAIALASFLAALPFAGAEAIKPDYHLGAKPENMIFGYFSAETRPALKIKDGQIVEVDTTDLSAIKPDKPEEFFIEHGLSLDLPGVKDLIAIKKEVKPTGIRGHMMTGPIYIEGAEPGDTLEVRFLEVKSRVPYAVNQGRPGSGGVPDKVPRPYSKFIPLDLERNVAVFSKDIEVPLKPFEGVMAVAPPAHRGKLRSGPPYCRFRWNFDNPHLGKSPTVYFPVQVTGALFHIGDPHAVQGDGEVS